MNNYIHKIIDFFFHHEVSDEITERVYNRMVFPVEDKAREEAVSQIWDKLDDASCSDEKIEKAFYNLETSLGFKKEEQTIEFVHRVNPEKPDVPLNKNDAFQKVQKRRVQEKR